MKDFIAIADYSPEELQSLQGMAISPEQGCKFVGSHLLLNQNDLGKELSESSLVARADPHASLPPVLPLHQCQHITFGVADVVHFRHFPQLDYHISAQQAIVARLFNTA